MRGNRGARGGRDVGGGATVEGGGGVPPRLQAVRKNTICKNSSFAIRKTESSLWVC